MAASVDVFKERFPEFKSREPAQLEAALAAAEERTDDQFDTEAERDEIVYLQMAETLSAGTQGRNARPQRNAVGGKSSTSYSNKLFELQSIHALSRRTSS